MTKFAALVLYPAIGFVAFVALLYYSRWQARRKVARLGLTPPGCNIPGVLGLGFFYYNIKTWREHKLLEWWEDVFAKNGCADQLNYTADAYILGSKRSVITADPENIKHILATDFSNWGKGKLLHDQFSHFLGDGVLAVDGPKWHSARQAMRPLFLRERVADLALFERNVQRLLPKLGNGQKTEIDDWIFRYTLDNVSFFLLGQGFGTLNDEANRFTDAFNKIQKVQSLMMRTGPFYALLPKKEYKEGIRVVESYIKPSIEKAMALSKSGDVKFSKSKADESNTLLHALVAYTDNAKDVRDNLMSVLFAGSDTTASALTWLIFELSRNPQVVQKLRQKIHEVIGTDPDRMPTYEELKDMKYLTNCINETLRLYATMPFATRQALRDTTLPRGGGPDGKSPIAILKDTSVIYSALLMHRRRDLYPETGPGFADPRTWSPERWDVWQPKVWTTISFSGGQRICIGQNFAVTEIAYTIVRLVQKFERFDDYNPRGKADPVLKYGIVATPEEGVHVGFVPTGTC